MLSPMKLVLALLAFSTLGSTTPVAEPCDAPFGIKKIQAKVDKELEKYKTDSRCQSIDCDHCLWKQDRECMHRCKKFEKKKKRVGPPRPWEGLDGCYRDCQRCAGEVCREVWDDYLAEKHKWPIFAKTLKAKMLALGYEKW